MDRVFSDRPAESSVRWMLDGLKADESAAQRAIWNRYFAELAAIARRRLQRAGAARRSADEEDVVLSVFDSLFARAKRGEFGQLADELGLWKLLLTLTERKAFNQSRTERAQKRGGGRVRGDSVFERSAGQAPRGLDQAAYVAPTSAEAEAFIAAVRECLEGVDSELALIGELQLCGYSQAEIA